MDKMNERLGELVKLLNTDTDTIKEELSALDYSLSSLYNDSAYGVIKQKLLDRLMDIKLFKSGDSIEILDGTDESSLKDRVRERKEGMENFDYKFNNKLNQNIDEIEREPAYKRLGVDLGEKEKELIVYIDKGNATNEEIASVIAKINRLYRLFGGNGMTFINENARVFNLNTY